MNAIAAKIPSKTSLSRKLAPSRRLVVVASSGNGSTHTGEVQNVVIIGSGPAGYTAAIYASRASLR